MPCASMVRLSAVTVFNLCEGVDGRAIEAKVEAYRIANAESIAAVEARNAEEVRRKAAEERGTASPGSLAEALSGTAAAFEGGRDAEPHQGMDYTAQLPSGMLAQASASRWGIVVMGCILAKPIPALFLETRQGVNQAAIRMVASSSLLLILSFFLRLPASRSLLPRR